MCIKGSCFTKRGSNTLIINHIPLYTGASMQGSREGEKGGEYMELQGGHGMNS